MTEAVSLGQSNKIQNPFAEFNTQQTKYYFTTPTLPESTDCFLPEKAKEEKETSNLEQLF